MRKIPRKEEVVFNSCKTKDQSTLAFDVTVTESNGPDTMEFAFKAEFPVAPHPDLTSLLAKLKPRLVESFGWGIIGKIATMSQFQATAAQKKYLAGALETIEDNIKVTGVQYVGKNNTGAIIKGTYDGAPINAKIYFTNQDYGADMEEIIEKIGDEVYEYVYKNKRQQLEAFDED